ncbi:hypothetical protein [Cryptosporangium phraense]|uniref:Uncharacterized protein n=1 Tax=Cryptosporangium phraense TaxID=2593070 RepID=A0A545ANI1_9ACTN|nr:hypothetical protein [Cryptosporangium phraense]TQS42833.1 hypothetical protein FL583_22545 [Cryptosporangium phraense]
MTDSAPPEIPADPADSPVDAGTAGTAGPAADDTALSARDRIWAALARLGQATAGELAAAADVGYSTTSPKLRSLLEDGLAERREDNGRISWSITTAGRTRAPGPTTPATDEAADDPEAEPHRTAATCAPTGDSSRPFAAPHDTRERDKTIVAPELPAAELPPAAPATDASPSVPSPTPAPNTFPSPSRPSSSRPNTADGQKELTTGHKTAALDAATSAATPPEALKATSTVSKRAKGALTAEVFEVLKSSPDAALKVGEVSRLVDQAAQAAGLGLPPASPGAVVLALDRLVDAGRAVQTLARPATYQLAAGAE